MGYAIHRQAIQCEGSLPGSGTTCLFVAGGFLLVLAACAPLRSPQLEPRLLHSTQSAGEPSAPSAESQALLAHKSMEEFLSQRAARLSPAERTCVAHALLDAEREHGLDRWLLVALIMQESGFNPRARSKAGALGLMQLHAPAARETALALGIPWQGKTMLLDPELNVRLGSGYFAAMTQMYDNDWMLALAAYNMGPFRVRRMLTQGKPPRSAFARNVLTRWQHLQNTSGNLSEHVLPPASPSYAAP